MRGILTGKFLRISFGHMGEWVHRIGQSKLSRRLLSVPDGTVLPRSVSEALRNQCQRKMDDP